MPQTLLISVLFVSWTQSRAPRVWRGSGLSQRQSSLVSRDLDSPDRCLPVPCRISYNLHSSELFLMVGWGYGFLESVPWSEVPPVPLQPLSVPLPCVVLWQQVTKSPRPAKHGRPFHLTWSSRGTYMCLEFFPSKI